MVWDFYIEKQRSLTPLTANCIIIFGDFEWIQIVKHLTKLALKHISKVGEMEALTRSCWRQQAHKLTNVKYYTNFTQVSIQRRSRRCSCTRHCHPHVGSPTPMVLYKNKYGHIFQILSSTLYQSICSRDNPNLYSLDLQNIRFLGNSHIVCWWHSLIHMWWTILETPLSIKAM